MNFTSQICTTKEQSERLLTLGLKKETADMSILTNQIGGDGIIYSLTPYNELIYPKVFGAIPAWSLHRLIEIYSKNSITPRVKLDEIDFCWLVDNIEFRIKECDIYKDYLEGEIK